MHRWRGILAVGFFSFALLQASAEEADLDTQNDASQTTETENGVLGHWLNFSASDASVPIPGDVNLDQKIKFGAAYKMKEASANPFGQLVQLAMSPSETVAQRRFFAYEFDELTLQHWQTLREEVVTGGDTPRLTILVESDGSYFGTPVKWNKNSATAFETAFAASDEAVAGDVTDNALPKWLAVELVQTSVDVSGQSDVEIEFCSSDGFLQTAGQADEMALCVAGGPIAASENARLMVGLSYEPDALKAVPNKMVVTAAGLDGSRLGSDYPSWPSQD